MENIQRQLRMALPAGQSAFLWGARKVGKSSWLKQQFPDSLYFDLLKTDLMIAFTQRPALLRELILAADQSQRQKPIIIDEVQKVPHLLDEVQGLIEDRGLSFILCGSSARKLKRGQGNLLGGRAWRFAMLPLTARELGEIDLLQALNRGLVPAHYLQSQYRRSLRAYLDDYLKEEVFDEGLTRNIPAFSRFFEAIGYSHGELTNYANIARECGVDAKTVKEYYQILVDTLLGSFVPPFKPRQNRNIISKAAKFYLFDVGVAGALQRRELSAARGEDFGRAFEHFIYMELYAQRAYGELDHPIEFWRTKSGQEVDFVLDSGRVAIEVKGTDRLRSADLHGIKTFVDAYQPRQAFIVCQEPRERLVDGIRILPWQLFLERLWRGEII